MTATHPGDHARRLLAQRLTQATTPDELQAIGRELLDRYVTFRYAAEALLEAVLDGRPATGRRRKGDGAPPPTVLRTSAEQWAVLDRLVAEGWQLTDLITATAKAVLDDPPASSEAADLSARYGRGTVYGRGRSRTWRPDPTLGADLDALAKRLGVTVSVLLRWGLDRTVM